MLVWNVEPYFFKIGNFGFAYYSILFILGLVCALKIFENKFKKNHEAYKSKFPYNDKFLSDFFTYIMVCGILGAKFMHYIMYQPDQLVNLFSMSFWRHGLASHGGFLGIFIGIYFFSKKYKVRFWLLMDVIVTPLFLLGSFIRLGNFMNSELVGLPTDMPWAVVFERVDMLARHPVQLYESIMYFVLFLLFRYIDKILGSAWVHGMLFSVALIVGGFSRIFLEVFKTEQSSIELIPFLSMGQILSIPFILVGFYLWRKLPDLWRKECEASRK